VYDNNNRNLQYFESSSIRGLYESIQHWQSENNNRVLSLSIQRDDTKFCCVALTNASEVVIVGGSGYGQVDVSGHALRVDTSGPMTTLR